MKVYLISLSAALLLVIAAFFYGRTTGAALERSEWLVSQVEVGVQVEAQRQLAAKRFAETQNQLLEIEQAWLLEQPLIKVEYLDRIKTVTEVVEVDRGLDVCRLDGERLRLVQEAVKHANDY